MRFRGAAYIVARMGKPAMQQGRLWICSLFPLRATCQHANHQQLTKNRLCEDDEGRR
jgi:hypothetical protein